jgi:thiamine transporter ThiT
MTQQRPHPYLRAALIGFLVGVLAGIVAYGVFRVFGTSANFYLLGAIVLACIPGAITLSLILEGDTLEARD